MDAFTTFEQDLQNVLNHLYDPAYSLPLESLRAALGTQQAAGSEGVRGVLLQAIEALKPAADVPLSARGWRIYNLLSCRYVRRMTQEETAEHLGITPRHLRREQNMAVHALASLLWEQRPGRAEVGEMTSLDETTASEWLLQVKDDLTALQRSAGGVSAEIGDTVSRVAGLVSVLTSRYGIALVVEPIQPGLLVAVHPSGLRQILMQTISELARHMSGGSIAVRAEPRGVTSAVIITGQPVAEAEIYQDHLIRELLAIHHGSIGLTRQGEALSIHISLPSERVNVLVVDDNTDLVHFYRRFVQGTRYNIITLDEGRRTLKEIEQLSPDVIVLDAMLPDVDGWELLAHLRANPATRSIPIILCSVVREEELALVLGATLYLPKPVRRQQFLQALDQASDRFG